MLKLSIFSAFEKYVSNKWKSKELVVRISTEKLLYSVTAKCITFSQIIFILIKLFLI